MSNSIIEMIVKYAGATLIILAIGTFICLLACMGYNIYLSASKEKIEVSTTNTNSNIND